VSAETYRWTRHTGNCKCTSKDERVQNYPNRSSHYPPLTANRLHQHGLTEADRVTGRGRARPLSSERWKSPTQSRIATKGGGGGGFYRVLGRSGLSLARRRVLGPQRDICHSNIVNIAFWKRPKWRNAIAPTRVNLFLYQDFFLREIDVNIAFFLRGKFLYQDLKSAGIFRANPRI
jgi:hypothetical protein